MAQASGSQFLVMDISKKDTIAQVQQHFFMTMCLKTSIQEDRYNDDS